MPTRVAYSISNNFSSKWIYPHFFRIADPLINGQEATFSTTKNPESQTVVPDTSRYPHPVSHSTIVRTTPTALQQLPRDRANSVDNHVLRSLFAPGGESSSRGISSASSMSPIHPLMPLHTPQHSPIDNMSQATTSSPSSRSNGLLYSLLVSADSRPPSCRLKQPLAPSSSTTSSTSEPKKHKLEDSTQRFGSSNTLLVDPHSVHSFHPFIAHCFTLILVYHQASPQHPVTQDSMNRWT